MVINKKSQYSQQSDGKQTFIFLFQQNQTRIYVYCTHDSFFHRIMSFSSILLLFTFIPYQNYFFTIFNILHQSFHFLSESSQGKSSYTYSYASVKQTQQRIVVRDLQQSLPHILRRSCDPLGEGGRTGCDAGSKGSLIQ